MEHLEPRQLAENAVQQDPAKCLQIILRQRRPAVRRADGAPLQAAGLARREAGPAGEPLCVPEVHEEGREARAGRAQARGRRPQEDVLRGDVAVHEACRVQRLQPPHHEPAQDRHGRPALRRGAALQVQENLHKRGAEGLRHNVGLLLVLASAKQPRQACVRLLLQLSQRGDLFLLDRPLDSNFCPFSWILGKVAHAARAPAYAPHRAVLAEVGEALPPRQLGVRKVGKLLLEPLKAHAEEFQQARNVAEAEPFPAALGGKPRQDLVSHRLEFVAGR
mmetsp:Transcript_89898/g.218024  ORF Transcript_89898/g.218024 Transcript_89898/m.218024 type:complete len:277 (-) Transcript_89898:940-1770(-)